MPAILIVHFKAIAAFIYINGTRVRSARAHSQQCTTAAVKCGHSRVNYDTVCSRWWILKAFDFDLHFEWCVQLNHFKRWFWWKLVQTTFSEWGVCWLTLINNISRLFQQIALRWCVLRLTSDWWKLLDESGWVAQWLCVVKLTQIKWSQILWMNCVLRVISFAAHSNWWNQGGANMPAVNWDVLHLTSKWFFNSWIMVRSMDSIRWSVIRINFQTYN